MAQTAGAAGCGWSRGTQKHEQRTDEKGCKVNLKKWKACHKNSYIAASACPHAVLGPAGGDSKHPESRQTLWKRSRPTGGPGVHVWLRHCPPAGTHSTHLTGMVLIPCCSDSHSWPLIHCSVGTRSWKRHPKSCQVPGESNGSGLGWHTLISPWLINCSSWTFLLFLLLLLQGFVPAINALAWYYEQFKQDYRRAVELWERADLLLCPDAALNLGIVHSQGLYPGKAADQVRSPTRWWAVRCPPGACKEIICLCDSLWPTSTTWRPQSGGTSGERSAWLRCGPRA